MPITTYDDAYDEIPRPADAPTTVIHFGAGDTRVQRVWTGGRYDADRVELRVFEAPSVPVGTLFPPGTSVTHRPAVVLSFTDVATAKLVLDYWLASLGTKHGVFPAAIRNDPRYTMPPDTDGIPDDFGEGLNVPDGRTWDTPEFDG